MRMDELTRRRLDKFAEEFSRLDKRSDKLLEKVRRYEKMGLELKAARALHLANEDIDQMIGMETALNILGFELKYRTDVYVVVEKG